MDEKLVLPFRMWNSKGQPPQSPLTIEYYRYNWYNPLINPSYWSYLHQLSYVWSNSCFPWIPLSGCQRYGPPPGGHPPPGYPPPGGREPSGSVAERLGMVGIWLANVSKIQYSRPGKGLHSYGKSPCLIGQYRSISNSTMVQLFLWAIFNSYFDITRGYTNF